MIVQSVVMSNSYIRRWYEDRRREVLREINLLEVTDNLRTQRHRYLIDRLEELNKSISYYREDE